MNKAVNNSSQLSIKVNTADKNIANKMFKNMGLNMSTAVNMFLKQVIAQGRIPFQIKDPYYNKTHQKELNQRVDDVVLHHHFKEHHINV